jgi:tetratricopeptide (TPR) repeat protein
MNRRQRRAGAAAGGGPAGLTPAFVEIFNRALALQQAGRLPEAEALYRQAMAMNPNVALLYSNLGVVMYAQGGVAESIPFYQKAIALDPTLSLAHNNLGVALSALGRLEEALAAFSKTIALVPDDPEPTNNYGDVLVKMSRFAEAAAVLERALRLRPNYVEAYTNLGTAYWGLGRLDDAVACFRRAIAIAPDTAMAHKNLGIVMLLTNNFAEGWREYEWRNAADKILPRNYPFPEWQGQPLPAGKKLLVWAEQGVGDEILQAGMIGDLLERGFELIYEVDPRMVALMRRSFPAAQVVARAFPHPPETLVPAVGAHISAASMGRHLRLKIEDFHKDRHSYLLADRDRSAALRARLNLAPGEKLVGLSWVSTNLNFGRSKSISLAQWAPILKTPGVKFVDLQYGDTAAERAAVAAELGVEVIHVDGLDLRDDLDGFAALTAACDLVITVSNSTAHFAGALGVPVWIFVSAGVGKFWYWGLTAPTVPWYPSATLIRQNAAQDWTPSLAHAAARLAEVVAGASPLTR